jgi:ubiquinone biosynthesis protein COQ4
MALPTLMRTIIHYPSTWPAMSRHITNGMRVGRESDPWFLRKMEPIFGMSKDEARAHIGMKGVEEVDTAPESDVWSEGAQSAQLVQAAE